MAFPAAEARRITEQHRQAQVANQQGFLAEFLAMWALLEVVNLDSTTPNWLRAVMRLIDGYRQESATLALDFGRRYRQLEVPDVTSPPPDIEFYSGAGPHITLNLPPTATRVPRAQPGRPRSRVQVRMGGDTRPVRVNWRDRDPNVEASLRITGPQTVKYRVKMGEPPPRAARNASAQAAGAALRHVADGGRDTALTLVENDRAALGWIRITAADPCGFCSMLASRGITWGRYSKKSFAASDIKFEGDPRDDGAQTAKVHDRCRCVVVPVWREDDPRLDLSKQWRQQWNDHISGRFSGKDAINAWRRLQERPEFFLDKQYGTSRRRSAA